MKRLLILIPFLLACSLDQSKQAVTTITAATDLVYYYENGQVVKYVEKAELTSEEVSILLDAMYKADTAKTFLVMLQDDPQYFVLNRDRVEYEYSVIQAAYLRVRDIAIKHREDYSFNEWETLQKFDTAALNMDTQFGELMQVMDTNSALFTALQLADTVFKIVSLI